MWLLFESVGGRGGGFRGALLLWGPLFELLLPMKGLCHQVGEPGSTAAAEQYKLLMHRLN